MWNSQPEVGGLSEYTRKMQIWFPIYAVFYEYRTSLFKAYFVPLEVLEILKCSLASMFDLTYLVDYSGVEMYDLRLEWSHADYEQKREEKSYVENKDT